MGKERLVDSIKMPDKNTLVFHISEGMAECEFKITRDMPIHKRYWYKILDQKVKIDGYLIEYFGFEDINSGEIELNYKTFGSGSGSIGWGGVFGTHDWDYNCTSEALSTAKCIKGTGDGAIDFDKTWNNIKGIASASENETPEEDTPETPRRGGTLPRRGGTGSVTHNGTIASDTPNYSQQDAELVQRFLRSKEGGHTYVWGETLSESKINEEDVTGTESIGNQGIDGNFKKYSIGAAKKYSSQINPGVKTWDQLLQTAKEWDMKQKKAGLSPLQQASDAANAKLAAAKKQQGKLDAAANNADRQSLVATQAAINAQKALDGIGVDRREMYMNPNESMSLNAINMSANFWGKLKKKDGALYKLYYIAKERTKYLKIIDGEVFEGHVYCDDSFNMRSMMNIFESTLSNKVNEEDEGPSNAEFAKETEQDVVIYINEILLKYEIPSIVSLSEFDDAYKAINELTNPSKIKGLYKDLEAAYNLSVSKFKICQKISAKKTKHIVRKGRKLNNGDITGDDQIYNDLHASTQVEEPTTGRLKRAQKRATKHGIYNDDDKYNQERSAWKSAQVNSTNANASRDAAIQSATDSHKAADTYRSGDLKTATDDAAAARKNVSDYKKATGLNEQEKHKIIESLYESVSPDVDDFYDLLNRMKNKF